MKALAAGSPIATECKLREFVAEVRNAHDKLSLIAAQKREVVAILQRTATALRATSVDVGAR